MGYEKDIFGSLRMNSNPHKNDILLRNMIYGFRRMIHLLRKHDIISVPSYAAGIYHPPQVDIISKIYHPFRQERISLKNDKFLSKLVVFHGGVGGIRLHFFAAWRKNHSGRQRARCRRDMPPAYHDRTSNPFLSAINGLNFQNGKLNKYQNLATWSSTQVGEEAPLLRA